MKYKVNGKWRNKVFSTNPVISRYHATFGEPLERQEISAEYDLIYTSKETKTDESRKLMGRVDQIIMRDEFDGVVLVKDDFGVHVMYEAVM